MLVLFLLLPWLPAEESPERPVPLRAQVDVRAPDPIAEAAAAAPLRFRRLTADDDLPASTIHHVMQDREGFIWLSTRRGVIRYDGRSFVSFQQDPLDDNSLSSNTVWVTAEDRRGWIWMGTLGGGLTIYRPRTGRFLRVPADTTDPAALQANTVTALHEDASGRMWVGTDGGGLSRARIDRSADTVRVSFQTVGLSNASGPSPPNDRVLDIAETPTGALWLATYGGGVHRYDPATQTVTTYRHDPADPSSLSDDFVMSVALDEQGGVWAGTKYGGLNYVAPGGRVARVPLAIEDEPVEFVWRTRLIDGVLWVGTYGRGLARLSYRLQDETPAITAMDAAVHDPANPHSLTDDFVLAIFEDRTGVVWCGTDNDGLNLFYDAPYVRPIAGRLGDTGRPLRQATVTAALAWKARLWVGTTKGLFVRSSSGASFSRVPVPDSSSFIERLQPGPNGWLWICTNHGLYRYHEPTGRLVNLYAQIRARGVPVNDRFFDVVRQPDGTVWAGTDRGLVALRVAGPSLVSARLLTTVNRQLPAERIRRLARIRNATWIGTTGGGLARVTSADAPVQTLAALVERPRYATMKVLDVAGANGSVWVATHGGGVVHLRDSTSWTIYTEDDGLPGPIIRSIATDADGAIWATTAEGLARKRADTTHFERVPLPVPGVGGVSRMFAAPGGRLFVAGSDRGLLLVDPGAVASRSAVPPAVAVAEVQVMGQPLRLGPAPSPDRGRTGGRTGSEPDRTLHLAPEEDFVSVTFAVLDFAWPPANRLQYRLRERTQAWQPLGREGRVNVSNLAPGRHVLEARGAGLGGTWSPDRSRLAIQVAPAVWETTAFRLLVGLAGVALLGGVLMLRRRARRRARDRLRATRHRIADDLHDDLGSELASVALMLDVAQQRVDEQHQPLLREAADASREVARNLRDAIWIVDGSHDSLDSLLDHLRIVAARLSPHRPIQVEKPDGAAALTLSMEQRRHLLLLLKEALHNAVRHADADRISVSCRRDDARLTFTVQDDGTGFDPEHVEQGHGLDTMRRRAEAVDGTLTLRAEPDAGTTVTVRVPA